MFGYCKISKIGPRGLYFSKVLFEGLIYGRDLSSEGLIIGGKFAFQNCRDYNWREICVNNFECATGNIRIFA